jgi:hypothetical protein
VIDRESPRRKKSVVEHFGSGASAAQHEDWSFRAGSCGEGPRARLTGLNPVTT